MSRAPCFQSNKSSSQALYIIVVYNKSVVCTTMPLQKYYLEHLLPRLCMWVGNLYVLGMQKMSGDPVVDFIKELPDKIAVVFNLHSFYYRRICYGE